MRRLSRQEPWHREGDNCVQGGQAGDPVALGDQRSCVEQAEAPWVTCGVSVSLLTWDGFRPKPSSAVSRFWAPLIWGHLPRLP